MTSLVVITGLLLAVQFGHSVLGDILHVTYRSYAELNSGNSHGERLRCTAEFNNVVYEIYPKLELANSQFTGWGKSCSLRLDDIDFERAGPWKIRMDVTSWETKKNVTIDYDYEVQVTKILDAKEYESYEGRYVTVFHKEEFEDAFHCHLQKKNGIMYNLTDNPTGVEGFELYRKCGVRMPINKNTVGSWTLIQQSGEYKFRTMKFTVKIIPEENPIKKQSQELWYRGSTNEIKFDDRGARYCDLVQPDGQIVVLRRFPYNYKVENVSDIHSGLWRIRYINYNDIVFSEKHYNITVVDPWAIDVSITTSENRIHMLCKVNMNRISFCLFTKPDGNSTINVPEEIADSKYEYFGHGYKYAPNSGRLAECGLTIRNPTSEDYGLWKCTIGLADYDTQLSSAFVSTENLSKKQIIPPRILTRDTYVKRGDNFTIKCKTSVALEYCWLKSPNGTLYSVTKNRTLSNFLQYEGEGLAVGDCGAIVENADDTHAGDWSCRLGVVGSAEIESIVPVTVTDSYLIPVQPQVSLSTDQPELACRILPNKKENIQYCRWVRPNGNGIYVGDTNKYLRKYSPRTCTLHINEWNFEDLGTWRCYARLATGSDEEIYTTVEIVSSLKSETLVGANIILNIFAICLFIVSLIGASIFGWIFYKRRRNNRVTNNVLPPSYYNEYETKESNETNITIKENTNF